MASTTTRTYSVFGLTLKLPTASALLKRAAAGTVPDAVVEFGHAPQSLANPAIGPSTVEGGGVWSADPTGTVLLVTQHARYLVVGGSQIIIDPVSALNSSEGLVQFAVFHVLPALLLQRGLLVLHGNTATGPTGAVAILGDSGTGKSTLTAGLLGRGYHLVSDDIAVLGLGDSADVCALPGYPVYKLSWDTQTYLDPAAETRLTVFGSRRKRTLRVPPAMFAAEAATLRAILVLAKPAGNDLVIAPVSGVAKLQALVDHAYLAPLVQLRARDLAVLPPLLQDVPVYGVQRPADRWTVHELGDAVTGLVGG